MKRRSGITKNISKIDNLSCFGKVKLYKNSIQISGWTWKGREQRSIKLSDIKEVSAVTSRTGHNFFVATEDAVHALYMRKGSMSMAHVIKDQAGLYNLAKDLPTEEELRRAV